LLAQYSPPAAQTADRDVAQVKVSERFSLRRWQWRAAILHVRPQQSNVEYWVLTNCVAWLGVKAKAAGGAEARLVLSYPGRREMVEAGKVRWLKTKLGRPASAGCITALSLLPK